VKESAVTDVEALCRGFLQNAAARQAVVARVAPEVITAEYRTGYGAGWEAGQVAGLALAVSIISGQALSAVLDEATAGASVDAMFPFDLHVDAG